MHLLSSQYRSEFLATPQLIRFEYAHGKSRREPTLLIKASTVLLKYIVQGVKIQLYFTRMGTRLLYAFKIHDDAINPCILWSILEHDVEKKAIIALSEGKTCQLFLFNELAVNVAWVSRPVTTDKELKEIVAGIAIGQADHAALKSDASVILEQFHNATSNRAGFVIVNLPNANDWNQLFNKLITNHATVSPIELFESDEGSQQEQLAVWLTDSLHPISAHLSPQIPADKRRRELTDILLSYQYGSILLESKTLSIFGRDNLPSRTKLSRDISKHIQKAIGQLKGGIRQLKNGVQVTSESGIIIDVERTQPVHAIILIPDFELIEDKKAYGLSIIQNFQEGSGGFIHILDISELLRIVQAAEIISSRSKSTTQMMAFDYYLIERIKKACEVGTLCVQILLRFADD